jgi:ABC-2 type transport system permease protein
MTCAAMIWNYLESYQVEKGIKSTGPILIEEKFAGTALVKTEFENYVPGLVVISVIMLVFIAAVNIARDRQDGIFLRYRLTSSPAWVYLTANLLVFLTMAILAIGFSLVTAAFLGFRFNGTWPLVLLILILSVFPVLALGILCGIFVKSPIQAYLIACFPFLFLMFFSGAAFPVPETTLFTLGNLPVKVFDFIPTSHAVRAITKVLVYEQGFGQIIGELTATAVISALLFVPTLMLIRAKLKSEM